MKYGIILMCALLCLSGCAPQPSQPTASTVQAMPQVQTLIAAQSKVSYRITVTDAAGAPAPGVMLNVCSADLCRSLTTDSAGQVSFTGEPYTYTVKAQRTPQGYAAGAEILLSPAGGAFTMVLGE